LPAFFFALICLYSSLASNEISRNFYRLHRAVAGNGSSTADAMKVASPFADADGFSALNRGYAGYLSADESAFDFALARNFRG
jgi:hypothetical protein